MVRSNRDTLPGMTETAFGRPSIHLAIGFAGRARRVMNATFLTAIAATGLMAASAQAGTSGIVRHPIPGSDFPILQAVEIPADATLVYISGTVPQVIDDSAAEGAAARYGDTAAQTANILAAIEAKLGALDRSMGDIVKMPAYLVGPEGGDAMDFEGFMEGYTQYFATADQPNMPVRSVFEVAGLANPAWLVEVEVVAVRR